MSLRKDLEFLKSQMREELYKRGPSGIPLHVEYAFLKECDPEFQYLWRMLHTGSSYSGRTREVQEWINCKRREESINE